MFLRYSADLQPAARAFLDACDDDEARHIRVLIDQIRDNPTVDEQEIIALLVPPIVFRVLVKDGYWIAFHLRSFDLWILAIARGDSAPTSREVLEASRTQPNPS